MHSRTMFICPPSGIKRPTGWLGSWRGKSLCLDALLLGKQEIARHVAIMTPRLFTHARAEHMWEFCCLRLSEMEHETKHQRSVVR